MNPKEPSAGALSRHGRPLPFGPETGRPRVSFPPRNQALPRIIALILSLCAGLAVVRFNPLFGLGAVACASVAYVIVTRPFLGLLLYTTLFWWRPGELYPAVSGLHLERVVGALTLVGMWSEQHARDRSVAVDATSSTAALGSLTFCVVLSTFYAYRPALALDSTIDFVKIVAWYLLIVHLVNSRPRLWVFWGIWSTCVFKIALDSMRAYFFGGYSKYAQGITRAIGQSDAGGDPNHLAATMSVTIPPLLLLAFYKRLRWWRVPAACAVLLFTLTMSLTGSRSGLLGFFAGLAFLWWHGRRRFVVGLVGLAVIVGGLVILPEQYKTRYATITSKTLDGSSQGRINVWKVGLRILGDHPFTGIGVGGFSAAHAEVYSPDFQRNDLVSHSLYVELLSEMGLFGAAAFFWYIGTVCRLNRRTWLRLAGGAGAWEGERRLLLGMAAGIACLLLTGVFGTNFARHTWYVYGALIVAITRLRCDACLPGKPAGDALATARLGPGAVGHG